MARQVRVVTLALLLGLVAGVLVLGDSEGLLELHLYKLVLEEPSPVIRGEKVAVQAWVMNTGDRPADDFHIEFFYRPTKGRSWFSFDRLSVATLVPSRQHPFKGAATFNTSDREPGTYELRVVVDSNNRIPEGDETNNELVTTLIVLPSKLGIADLQPLELAFDPTSPSGGELVRVSTLVVNNGDKDAGLFKISFLVDGQEFDFTYVDWLSVGATTAVEGALDPDKMDLKPGSHKIKVVVDTDDQIDEQDEENNTLTGYLTIYIAELHPTSLVYDQPRLHLDGSTSVSSTIRNTGLGKAEKVEVAFTVNIERFALVTVGTLGPMEETTVEAEFIPANLTHKLDAGTYELAVYIDPSNLVTELDEANNVITKSLTLMEAEVRIPELHPESLEANPPSPVELGKADSVTVSSVIKNTGKLAAEGFDVSFRYRVKGAIRWQSIPCTDEVSCSGLDLTPGVERKAEGRLLVFGLPPGIYEIRVVVDPMETIEELDETNNELVTTLALLSSRLPDLTFDPALPPVEVLPSNVVKRGQTVRFVANLINLGDEDAGPFEVEFAYSRVPEEVDPSTIQPTDYDTFWTAYVPGLGVGERTKVEAVLETINLDPGTYYIQVVIDPTSPPKPSGEVLETDEINNVLEQDVLIQGIDLMAADLSIIPSSTVVQGEAVDLLATVINIGAEPAGDFCVSFYGRKTLPGAAEPAGCTVSCAGDCTILSTGECDLFGIGGVKFLGLDVGKAETASCALETAVLDPGVYQILVHVDPDDSVKEQYETNNQFPAILVIQQRPADLRAEREFAFEPMPPVSSGEPVKIHGAIVNDGGTLAENFRVVFHCFKREGDVVREILEFDAKSVDALAPGERLEIMGVLDTTGLVGGTYEICLVADPDNAVPESSEENNVYCTPPAFALLAPPDLQPIPELDYSPTPPVMAGESVTLTAKITNSGGSPSGGFIVEFSYRHTKRGITGEEITAAHSIPPGKTIEVPADLDTTGLPVGIYEICITADPGDDTPEADETNNTFCVPSLVLVSKPDLRAEPELTIEEQLPVMAGNPVTIIGKISNIGGVRANRSLVHFQYRHLGSGIAGPPAAVEIGPVLPGAEPVKVRWALDTAGFLAGAYEICMTADGPDLVPELDETNNRTCIPYLVLISKPDLAVQLAFEPDPPIVEPGEEVTTTATVTNQGGSRAGKSKLRFTAHPIDGGEPLEYETDVSGLDPDQSIPIEWKLDTTEMGGTYEVCAEADPGNFIDELDEGNNSYCTPPPFIVIGPGVGKVDLAPVELVLQPSAIVRKGQKVTIFATITNRGTEYAGPFVVKLYREYVQGDTRGAGVGFALLGFNEGLGPGATKTRRGWLRTSTLQAGDHLIRAVVDPDGEIDESNEDNNQIEVILSVTRDRDCDP